eukprot:g3127.t1
MMRVRARALERRVLSRPPFNAGFTVWGAGRDGRALVNELLPRYRGLVRAFCDVDPKKIGTRYVNGATGMACDVVHFERAVPPILVCVALDRGGALESNVAQLAAAKGLREGVDLIHFC